MFRNMEYVYAVWQERSFSRAAERLHISQSSLSLTIKHVEEKIGMKIFDINSLPVDLTEFGKLYIEGVKEVMSLTRGLENYAYDVNHLKRGKLSIGTGNFFAINLIAPAIAEFKEKYPNVDIELLEGRSADLEPELNKGNIDLLITNASLDTAIYTQIKLFTENLMLVVPKHFFSEPPCPELIITQQALKNKKRTYTAGVSLKYFEDLPFIALRPGNDTKIRMDKIFSEHKIHPKILLELDQSATAFALSCNGLAASIVSDAIISKSKIQHDILIYRLEGECTSRDVCVYMKRSEYVTAIQKEFIKLLRDKKYQI